VESDLSSAAEEAAKPEVAVFVALRRELEPLERVVAMERRAEEGGFPILAGTHGGLRVVLAQTGPGRDRAGQAASLVFDRFRPEVAMGLGFAGGLRRELRVGDLVICQSLCYLKEGSVSRPLACDRRLVQASLKACQISRLGVRSGGSLTVEKQCSLPGIKEQLGSTAPAEVVEMENYWLAQEAARRAVPFLAVRAVSDTVGQALPPEDLVDQRGEVNKGRVAHYLLHQPRGVVYLLRLAKGAQRAASNLACFLEVFLTLWQEPQWRADDHPRPEALQRPTGEGR
jgi:adenosylhomocysteine nucleosidase